ncbi:acyl-homoserine-lactone synthase [Jannaschia formosa]|uniref:acyl-homoserine-lactone synthase n=1 Tax=Jannaschia formosa TaxID=2259592 RepID=UPI001075313B|nr:acyl-homoserine-lactone synthase [Jannaschia formosa]TFL18695.1 autoinducer synthase [Jannaschia formosa]
MRSITFDMSTMHLHGPVFYDFLKLRKSFFVDELGWRIPTDGIVEMDQYDTPLAKYSVVLEGDRVIGGARCQPCNSSWGIYTYMLNDFSRGLIPGGPVIPFDPSAYPPEKTWEGTRLVVSDHLRSRLRRMQCLALIIDGLVRVIRQAGGTSFLTFSPLPLQRTAALVGLQIDRLTYPILSEEDGREYAVFRCLAERAPERLAELGVDAERGEIFETRLNRIG